MQNSPFNPGYYTEDELQGMGFKAVGKNVQIAKNNTIIGLDKISIGDNVRIDGYCIFVSSGEGSIDIGSYIHIGAWCYLSASEKIRLSDFSGLSQNVKIYTANDDYSGQTLTNPTVPREYTNVMRGEVSIGKHAIVGSGSVILPNTTIGEGASIGALSLVTKDMDDWGVYFGSPAKKLKNRSKKLLELEQQLLNQND